MSPDSALEAYRAGDLAGALSRLQQDIRSRPADSALRVFLAQLLMVTGDWDRAAAQLKVAAELDAQVLDMKHAYTAALYCERIRSEVFAGQRPPLLFGEPERWMALFVQAIALSAQGEHGPAASARAQALEDMPDCAGRANDVPFDWIGDADSRIGPFFELLIEAKYFWVPVSRVRRLALEPPADLRDLVWMPVSVVWVNGGESQGLMPARYPGSERSTDSAIQLGRKTDWKALEADTYIGLGEKCLMTDQAEIAVCDLRELELNA